MKLRSILFWLHLSAGVLAGIVILLMCVTGVVLGYEHQILRWSLQEYRSIPPSPDARRLSSGALLANARAAHAEKVPATIAIASDPLEPVSVGFGRDLTVYLNPYTGAVLGEGSKGLQSFFLTAEYLHRWIAAKGDWRATGRLITGLSNFLFAVLVLSGPFLWWPRDWRPAVVRSVAFFKRGLSGRARDFNWHNTIGIWCAVPLALIVLSAVVMSFPWANDLLFRLSGSPPPPRATGPGPGGNVQRPAGGQRRQGASSDLTRDNLDALWARAEQQVPGWHTITLRVPNSSDSAAAFTIDSGDGGHPDKRGTLTLDVKTTDVVRWEPWASLNRGRQMRAWVRFGHTGEAGGFWGETIAVIASLGGAFLVWTGLSLALRRLFRWSAARFEPAVTQEAVAVAQGDDQS